MMFTAVLLSFALSSTPVAAGAQEAPDRPEDDRSGRPAGIEVPGDRARIPFELARSRPIPVVEAHIGGKGPFRFFYDTGASVCVLDSSLVAELGLELAGTGSVRDGSGAEIPVDELTVEHLTLGDVQFFGVPAIAFDRSRFSGDEGIRGVLGLPLFESHLLTLDYANGWLDVSDEELAADAKHVLPYDATGPLPELVVTIGGEELVAHVDSGSPAGFMLPTSLLERIPSTDPVVIGRGRMVASEFEISSADLECNVVFAGHVYENPSVRAMDVLEVVNLGYEVLREFRVSIDQRASRMRFLPVADALADGGEVEAPEAKKPRRRLGAAFAPGARGLVVQQVFDGSPARAIGLQVGDELVSVDGREMDGTGSVLGEALDGDAAIRFEVLRDGESLELVLPARSDEEASGAPSERYSSSAVYLSNSSAASSV